MSGTFEILFRSWEVEVVRAGVRLEIRKRPRAALFVGLTAWAVALLLLGLGAALKPWLGGALEALLAGGAGLIALVGALAMIGSLVLAVSPGLRTPYCLDLAARELIQRGRAVPFDRLGEPQLERLPANHLALSVAAQGQRILLLSAVASRETELEALRHTFRAALDPSGQAALTVESAARPIASMAPEFAPLVILFMGVLWSGAGYFLFGGLYFTDAHGGARIPVWSLGLLMIVLSGAVWLQGRKRKLRDHRVTEGP